MNRPAIVLAALALAAGSFAAAQEMPIPQVFNQAFKSGQWRVEMLEMKMGNTERAGGGMPAMSICMDDIREMGRGQPGGRDGPRRDCKVQLVKNTPTEAIMESACPDGTTRTTVTREGDKSYRIHSTGTSRGENYSMRARYTFEGEKCTQSGVGFGGMGAGAGAAKGGMRNDSPECQQARAQLGSMNPGAMCANAGANRAACEQNVQRMRSQLEAMCR